MRLRHIEVFNAVMLTGSVSSAARLMNVTQPAVSRILAHAELQLGFELFQRIKGRLSPTPEAQTLHPHIERLFSQLDEVQRLANNLKMGRNQGEIRILSVLALSHEILPRALKKFSKLHPNVTVKVDSLHSSQIVEALVLHEADMGFLFSAMAHPSLEQRHLADGRMVCVVPKGMLPAALTDKGMVSLAELSAYPVISLDAHDPLGASLGQACREAQVSLSSAICVQTYHTALALAHHGLGVAFVDSFTAISADRSKVDLLELSAAIMVPVKSLHPTNRPNSILTSALARCMQEAIVAALG